jgi:CBS domain-containing protein
MSFLLVSEIYSQSPADGNIGEIMREHQQLDTPLGNFSHSQHWTTSPDTPIIHVLAEMSRRNSDVAVIVNEECTPLGIFTQRDLLGRVVIPGLNLELPIRRVMTCNPVTLPCTALGYEAIVAMVKGGFHHVVLVTNERVVGTVSEHDLFTIQRVSLGQLAARINSADSLDSIRECASEVRDLVEYMFIQGVATDQITQIISTMNDQLIKRVIDLETSGADLDEINVCWIVMGSEGWFEQTISTDQDNAAIFDHPAHLTPDEARKRLIPVAQRVNQTLHEIGFPLCSGNLMAGNPEYCLSLSEWKKKFHGWIIEPTPEALLHVRIFFDFRALHGDLAMAENLRSWLTDAAVGQKRFLSQMTEEALQKSPPFSFFNNFLQENHPDLPHSIDIKVRGVNIFVDAARIYALSTGITSTKTNERLLQSADKFSWTKNMVGAWLEAFSFLQGIRIRQQHHLKKNGQKSHNRLNLCALNSLEQKICTEAFRQAGQLQKKLESDFRNNLIYNIGA